MIFEFFRHHQLPLFTEGVELVRKEVQELAKYKLEIGDRLGYQQQITGNQNTVNSGVFKTWTLLPNYQSTIQGFERQ